MGKLLAPLGSAVNRLITNRFQYTEGSRLHLSSTGRMPGCVSWTSSWGSRCPFVRLSRNIAPIFSKFMKKRSSLMSPMQTSKGCNGTRSQRQCHRLAVCGLPWLLSPCSCVGPSGEGATYLHMEPLADHWVLPRRARDRGKS